MQLENGGGRPGERRDPLGGVGANRHQDVGKSTEDAEMQVRSPLLSPLAPQDRAKPWPEESQRSRNQTVGSGRYGYGTAA